MDLVKIFGYFLNSTFFVTKNFNKLIEYYFLI